MSTSPVDRVKRAFSIDNPESDSLSRVMSGSWLCQQHSSAGGDTPNFELKAGKELSRALYQLLASEDGNLYKSEFLTKITDSGLRLDDPRLEAPLKMMYKMKHGSMMQQILMASKREDDVLLADDFHEVIMSDVCFFEKALKQEFVIPNFTSFCSKITEIFDTCTLNNEGNVATYIPQLAKMNSKLWGVSLCTVDGQRFSLGDCSTKFCIQSCSKPITYAAALTDVGHETVHQYVGQEPSGVRFNAIALDSSNKPHNPMVNAGAIVLASLIKPGASGVSDKFEFIENILEEMSGGTSVHIDNATFLSEKDTADRNYALAYYMRENRCFPEGTNLNETLDFYFQLCSIEMDCESMSVVASTLANGGVCPITDRVVLNERAVCNTLSLMLSCGMYDYSGQFAFKIGLPAKSGVSGAVIVVVPNVCGFCLFSPKLDKLGNSCRGIQFCELLVNTFNFHNFDSLRPIGKKIDPRSCTRSVSSDAVTFHLLDAIYCASVGDLSGVMRYYFTRHVRLDAADYDQRTALHLAATNGHLHVVKFLIVKCKVDVNLIDRFGKTPLDCAMENNQTEVANFIRKNINLPDALSDVPTTSGKNR